MVWLIAGLGNPGERYANSRHNVGRMVVDQMARSAGERFRKTRFHPAEVAELRIGDERVVLVRSPRFMNESGPSYASIAKKHEVSPEHVVAVHDELDIPAGTIRMKFGGGNNGHNGLRSMEGALHTPDFLRVRLGIGRPPGRQDPADFVLQPIGKKDAADVALLVDDAVDAVRLLVEDGLGPAQDRYNRSGPGA
ncbi:MAG: aminoacyl-tRNA hydrolase [Actinomycetota bacterium]|nr:aminoacyl-tRNA hydrolase [Actinomycetota bacterium]